MGVIGLKSSLWPCYGLQQGNWGGVDENGRTIWGARGLNLALRVTLESLERAKI